VPIPQEAWAFAWSCLVLQLVNVAENGRASDNMLVPSMLLGAAVVGWFAHGVVRARMVRVSFVGVVLVLVALLSLVAVLDGGDGSDVLDLVLNTGQLGLFVAFVRTPYFRWRRTQPGGAGPSVAGLVAIGLVVGAVGGYIGADENSIITEVKL
jgi:hypothetical protein